MIAAYVLVAGALAARHRALRARPYGLRMAWLASSALNILAAACVAVRAIEAGRLS